MAIASRASGRPLVSKKRIASSSEFAIGPTAFDDFLFGPIGEEPNGMVLSVFSGLARLGLDPHEEAARLASLPMPAAIEALARMIATSAGGGWLPSDAPRIAARLVRLLPGHGAIAPAVQSPPSVPRKRRQLGSLGLALIFVAVLSLAVVIVATSREDPAGPDTRPNPMSTYRPS